MDSDKETRQFLILALIFLIIANVVLFLNVFMGSPVMVGMVFEISSWALALCGIMITVAIARETRDGKTESR